MMPKNMYEFVVIFRECILKKYYRVVGRVRKLIHLIGSLGPLRNEMQGFENTEIQMRIRCE